MEELTVLAKLQWEYRQHSLICFTDIWMNELCTDLLVTLNKLVWGDGTESEEQSEKGRGIVMFVNKVVQPWTHDG